MKLVINVSDYGAVGDGHTDAYQPIVDALDAASQLRARLVRIPDGVYLLSKPLPLRDNIVIEGNGRGITELKSSGNHPVFEEHREATNPAKSGVINLTIRGGGKHKKKAHGIVTHYSNRCRFENLTFRSCRHALDIAHAWQMYCTNLSVDGAGTDQSYIGWYMRPTTGDDINNAVQAVNCYVQSVEKYGFRLVNFQGSKFINCEAGGTMETAWYLGDPEPPEDGSSATKVTWGHFVNCLADSTTGDGWKLVRGAAASLGQIQLANCWAGNTGGHGMYIDGGDGIVLSNNLVIDAYKCALMLEHSNRITCTSSSMRGFNRSGEGYDGINLANSHLNTITGNQSYSDGRHGGDGGRGVAENGDAGENIVTSNVVSGVYRWSDQNGSIFDDNISG